MFESLRGRISLAVPGGVSDHAQSLTVDCPGGLL